MKLVSIEIRRLLSRKAVWLVVLLLASVLAYDLWQGRPLPGDLATPPSQGPFDPHVMDSVTIRLFGAISESGMTAAFYIFAPLMAGMVAAGSLAADRSRRYPALVLVRGVSRAQYLFAKAAGMAGAAGVSVFLSCALAFVAAAFIYPWGASTVNDPRLPASPFLELFRSYPLVHDLVLVALLSLATGSLALSGLAIGAVVANEYVAAATPFCVVIGGIFLLRGPLIVLGPETYLSLTESYAGNLPQTLWPYAAPVYWVAFGAVMIAVGMTIFLKKELD